MRLIFLMLRTFGFTISFRALVLDLLNTSPPQQKLILAELLMSLVYSGLVKVYHGRHIVDDHDFLPAIATIGELFEFNQQLHDCILQHFFRSVQIELGFESNQRLSLRTADGALNIIECHSTYFSQMRLSFTLSMLPLIMSIRTLVHTVSGLGPKLPALSLPVERLGLDYTHHDVDLDVQAVSQLSLLGHALPHLEQPIVVLRPTEIYTPSPVSGVKFDHVISRAVQALQSLPVHSKLLAFCVSVVEPMIAGEVDADAGWVSACNDEAIASEILAAQGKAVRIP